MKGRGHEIEGGMFRRGGGFEGVEGFERERGGGGGCLKGWGSDGGVAEERRLEDGKRLRQRSARPNEGVASKGTGRGRGGEEEGEFKREGLKCQWGLNGTGVA